MKCLLCRVYKNFDPRAKIIREVAEEVFQIQGRDPLIDVAVELEKRARADDYFVKRNLYPNVDFYSGQWRELTDGLLGTAALSEGGVQWHSFKDMVPFGLCAFVSIGSPSWHAWTPASMLQISIRQFISAQHHNQAACTTE